MIKFLKFSSLLLFVALFTSFAPAEIQGPDDITGVWLTSDKDAHVKVYKTTAGTYAGKLVWMKEPNEEDGSPKLDDENPKESLRDRPLQGLVFLTGFTYDADEKEWVNGKAYDPQSGKTYKAAIWMEDGNLKLRGYWGWFFRTETWTRVK